MKKHNILVLFFMLTMACGSLFAQINGYNYRTEFNLQEIDGIDTVDFQVLFRIDTQTLLANNLISAGGRDLRFSENCDGSVLLDYFIEDLIPSTATKIWVKIPVIEALQAKSIYMFYGNPSAIPYTNFDATFPLETRFDPILWNLGTQTGSDYSWAEIPEGTNLTLRPMTALKINARRIKINGSINGNSQGELRGLATLAGSGLGGGAAGADGNGGGGAGHGANGGTGNAGVTGGLSYDLFNSDTTFMGSGGGAADVSEGGNGGGAILLTAKIIDLNNDITVNGSNGTQLTSDDPAGGGGSGGGVLLKGDELYVTGDIMADGGSSGREFNNSNGGGGAGGRIKFWYANTISRTGLMSVEGGEPGVLAGGYGGDGTVYQAKYTSGEPVLTMLGTITMKFNLSSSAMNDSVCLGDFETIIGPTGFSNYRYVQVGVGTVQNSAFKDYSSTFNNGDQFYLIANVPGCSSIAFSDTITINAVPKTNASFTAVEDVELDWEFTNTSTGTITSYLWDFDDGTTSTDVNPLHTFSFSGTYDVMLTTYGDLPCATSTSIETIVVTCLVPTAGFTFTSDELTTTFTNTSVDADSVRWYSIDDPTFNYTTRDTIHTFPAPGTYLVCLEVKNYCQKIIICKNVTVGCIPPNSSFNVIKDELNVNLQSTSIGATSYGWSTSDGFASFFENTSYSFPDRGTYEVCLIAENDCTTDRLCKQVTVNCELPITDFSFIQSKSTFNFQDLTNNGTKWIWSFGDDGVETIQNPQHSFQALGNYLVCLRSFNACNDFFTYCLDVEVTELTGINDYTKFDGDIFPNPVVDRLNITFSDDIKSDDGIIKIYDITGKMLVQQQVINKENTVDFSEIDAGVYIVTATSASYNWTHQIIKE